MVYGAGFKRYSLRRQGFESLHYQSLCAYRINYLVLEIFNGPLRHLDLNENPYQMNRIIQRSVKTNLVKLIVDQNIPTSIINQSSDRSRIPNLKFLDPKSDVLKSGALFYYALRLIALGTEIFKNYRLSQLSFNSAKYPRVKFLKKKHRLHIFLVNQL